jgi:hypothetical protein
MGVLREKRSMEGAPLGHPCAAAAGIAGSWHTHGHDPAQGDPVGPFWMWKVEDNAERVFHAGEEVKSDNGGR